jgi:hypothetical protein
MIDFGAMYRLWERESAGLHGGVVRSTTVDLYAGGRFSYLELEVAPNGGGPGSRATEWVAPIVGARVVVPFGQHWQARGGADIGGFGLGCDLTWSVTALVGYDFRIFGNPSTIYLGYRALAEDYRKGSGADELKWDVVLHGPVLGLSFRF